MEFSRYQWHILNGLGLFVLAYVITDPFDLKLIFYDTILTGGDGGSWHQIATHLKESLIPNGRLFGWDQGNFFGYANLQHYFVFPFLVSVLLSYALPLTVALKLVTVSGFFALPFAVFWALRKLQYSHPIPLTAAWLSLLFLFHERYSMFGGNILSTLAGEFCYSIAFTLMVFFLGYLVQDMKQQKYSLRTGVLLGLIGLSHAFVFFVALLMPVFYLLTKPGRQTIKIILLIYLLGFLVMAFWALPMLSNLSYTTPISLNWRFASAKEFLESIHYEVLLVAVIVGMGFFFKAFRTREGSFFAYMIVCSILLYLIATTLRVPDIRFFPPLLFFSLLFIVDGCSSLLRFHKQQHQLASLSILGIAVLLGGSFVYSENTTAPQWFKWNYSGYETKPAFVDGRATRLFNALKGSYSDPRVAWEQGDHSADFGTGRVFESIPLFTGRASTEGIHYASALLSLPITILNGEYSYTPASPSANIYSHYFINSLPERFRMLNIRELIAFSPEITELLKESDEFQIVTEQPPYTLFTWKNHDTQYVVSPEYQPLVTGDYVDWKHRFTNWFRRGDSLDLTLVNGALLSSNVKSDLATYQSVDLQPTGIINDVYRIPLEPAHVTNEKISNFSILFSTNKPATPHIIKIAYSPNWRSVNAEPIYMVAPGFMLIYPDTEKVELVYGRHWSEYLGMILSFLGFIFIIYFSWKKQHLVRLLSNPYVEASVSGVLFVRKPLLTIAGILIVFLSFLSFTAKQAIHSDYIAGIDLSLEGRNEEAIEKFKHNSTMDKIAHIDDVDVPTSIYALGRTYRVMGEMELAEQEFIKLLNYYPRWVFIDEIYWHLGEVKYQQGKIDEAKALFEKCVLTERYGVHAQRCRRDLQVIKELTTGKYNE